MKKIFTFILGLILLVACQKEQGPVNVQYRVVDGYSDTEITWRNAAGELKSEIIAFESGADQWIQSYEIEKGEIVYLAGIYHDSVSSVKLQILIDGKVYKEKLSENDPGKYVVVSGTVPF